MRTFKATCEIVTPLFMGGASQQAELRTQSINGVLRWWFRVAGGSLEDEKRIFGWAGETSNQGVVRIFVKEPTFQTQPFPSRQPGFNYLGFSLKLTSRHAIPENRTFDLKISFHPKATDDDIKKFFSALWLAFNLGNFGSRARRGFGAIKIEKIIEEIKETESPITGNCYGLNFVPSGDLENWIKGNLEKIKEILKPNPRKDIPYLFENFEIYNFKSDNSWQNLLNEVGNEYKNFRQNERLSDRIIFGLPIIAVGKYRMIRRSSPLIFKIINTDKKNYTLLIIIIKPNTHKFIFHPDIKEDVKWDLLTNFVKSIRSIRRIYP
jgi:CRISPR-associated protein Cmr1